MFFNFLTISTISIFVYAFRGTPQLEQLGDNLNFVFKAVPSYCVASSVFIDALGNTLSKLRIWSGDEGTGGEIDPEEWALSNVTSDILASLAHFFVWTIVLVILEKRAMAPAKSNGLDTRDRENRQDSKIEQDVLQEERRIENNARDVV